MPTISAATAALLREERQTSSRERSASIFPNQDCTGSMFIPRQPRS
jgi:hypothetical protein